MTKKKRNVPVSSQGGETPVAADPAPSRSSLRTIWMLTREYGSLAGAGGVKDVAMQLAKALANTQATDGQVSHGAGMDRGRPQATDGQVSPAPGMGGYSVSVVMPRYGFMEPAALGFSLLADPEDPGRPLEYEVDLNYVHMERREKVRVWMATIDKVKLYLLEADRFAEKTSVYAYTAADEAKNPAHTTSSGHIDYFAMNILLQKGALDLMLLLDVRPDIIHCHDGHTAVLPAMLAENSGVRHFFRGTGTVVTIHNAGRGYHQEVADLSFAHASTGLPWRVIMGNRLVDCFDPFLAAAPYAVMNTVSEQYGRELQETDDDKLTGWLGHTLLERGVTLHGVTNGIDPTEFDPQDSGRSGIDASFSPLENGDLVGKRVCKEVLLRELGGDQHVSGIVPIGSLDFRPDLPLFTFIGRLNEQKGVGVLLAALRELLQERTKENTDFQIMLLGSGGHDEERDLAALARKKEHWGRICYLKSFNPQLANRIYAAGDFFLIPSRYEPCGLTDFIAQLFGNLPIVHHVGGLVKVLDGETGFAYRQHSPAALSGAMQRAMGLYHDDPARIREMQRQAVACIYERHTWQKVMNQYLQLYRKAKQGIQSGMHTGKELFADR
ncbi:MAG: glycogen [Desulfobulbaceae bacterium]|nr:MAG: glycogen [Desulfobulbaceae bacterium]